MKVLVAIFFVFLVAGASASVHPLVEKNSIIDDALELYKCITESITVLQDSINGLISTVSGIQGTVQDIRNMFDACLAIGGENPSLIEQIQQATCILGLVDVVRETVAATIAEVQNSVAQVVISGNNVVACFN